MLENLKVDIIYYGIDKDFEMEFNLCGCCHMRLLNSVAQDIKSLINSLKLAVARSKIIILCGDIRGENNLFNLISKAICRETEEIDNTIYGICSSGTTSLMKDSIPLISKDGVLCGCVVEEGPQSIIILSDKKEERKEIMNSLVHQYISEMSAIQSFEAPSCDSEESDNDTQQLNTETDNQQKIDEISEETANEENNDDLPSQSDEFLNDTTKENFEETNNYVNNELLCGFDEEDKEADILDYFVDDFSLIHTLNSTIPERKPRGHSKHSKFSNSSPLLAILICLLLCFVGILLYFLILKPLHLGISISDNFFRLFPFLSRRLF